MKRLGTDDGWGRPREMDLGNYIRRPVERTAVLASPCLLLVVAMLAFAPVASAGKVVVGAFGSTGTLGGEFGSTGKIAINSSGSGGVAAGTLYVADPANNRVQRLTPTGGFERAWGFGVDNSNPSTGFEICTDAADCKAGTSSQTTTNGGQLANPEGIDIDPLTGNVYVLETGGRRISEFDADGNFIRAWGAGVVSGVATFEICSTEAGCRQAAAAGTNGGQFANSTRSVKIGPSGNVWLADTQNRRLQKFDPSGNFIAVYGHNVNGGGALESCTSAAAGVCKAGTNGTLPGQFGGFQPFSFDFDSAGNLLANRSPRVEKFSPGITSASTFAEVATLVASGDLLVLPADHLLITQQCLQENENQCESGPAAQTEHRLVDLDAAGAPVETLLTGLKIRPVSGLARNAATGRVYAAITDPRASVVILEDAEAPAPPPMTVDPVTTKTGTTASFSGTIDPEGAAIQSCSFQFSTSASFTSATSVSVPGCSTLAPGGGAQSVAASVTGLDPNTAYFVRLAVTPLFVSTSTSSGETGLRSFTTDPVAPSLSNVGATQVSDTSAWLVGTIDFRNSGDLDYFFKYGKTPALGSTTAVASLASGPNPVIRSSQLFALDPGTTYYFQLVALNATGSTSSALVSFTTRVEPFPLSHPGDCANEALRGEREWTFLPDCRAYEMASPPDKNGGGAISGSPLSTVSVDGQAVAYCTTSLFGDPASMQMAVCANYLSRRSADGWQTRALNPHACEWSLGGSAGSNDNNYLAIKQVNHVSPGLHWMTIANPEKESCSIPPLSAAAPMPQKNLYRANLVGSSQYELLAPLPTLTSSASAGAIFAAASSDFSRILYTTDATIADAPAGSFSKIIEWDHGVLRLVSVMPNGNPFTTGAKVAPGTQTGSNADSVNGVTADADRIYFESPFSGAARELYLRESHSSTYGVSESECTVSCGSVAAKLFRFATPDGSKALFVSDQKLTDDTPTSTASFDSSSETNANLYMWTKGPDPASEPNLTLLSKDLEPADGVNADVLDVLGLGDDGNEVYFVGKGQIVPGSPTAAGPKLYRWRWNAGSPEIDYLATVRSDEERGNWREFTPGHEPENRVVTPGGGELLIQTKVTLDPVADADPDLDVYRWSEQQGWLCVSCQFPGLPSAGDSSLGSSGGVTNEDVISNRRRIVMSDDGLRVFFVTPDALVAADINEGFDVYEWNDGTRSLITNGVSQETTPASLRLLGASESGDDVFIYTTKPLVGWDIDSAGDVYDVRAGGGLPEPLVGSEICDSGEACRDASVMPAVSGGPGTSTFVGPPNQTQPVNKCKRGFVKRGKRCFKQCKRGFVRRGKRCIKRRQGRHAHRRSSHSRRAGR